MDTPIQPSWPAFHRSPSSTRYPRLSEVMKVHVLNIPIPINVEITRCIKVQDVFHLKVRLNPITSGVELHQNHTKRAVLSWHYFREKYFILHLKSSVLIWLSSDVKPAHNTLIIGWPSREHSALNSNTFWDALNMTEKYQPIWLAKGRGFTCREQFFLQHISINQGYGISTLPPAHWFLKAAQLYDFTQAIPHFHSINLSNVSPVSIKEQLHPLLYFISQSTARPVLSLNHRHPYPRTSAATNPRSCILHASNSKLPEGHMANFKIGHIHSITHIKNEPLHSFTRSANIFKSPINL